MNPALAIQQASCGGASIQVRDDALENASGLDRSENGQASESLQTLAKYLELALDAGASVLMIRHKTDVCTLYVGDPAAPLEELKRRGTIAVTLANEILDVTRPGANQLEIGGQAYRFIRSFTAIDGIAAVVFSSM